MQIRLASRAFSADKSGEFKTEWQEPFGLRKCRRSSFGVVTGESHRLKTLGSMQRAYLARPTLRLNNSTTVGLALNENLTMILSQFTSSCLSATRIPTITSFSSGRFSNPFFFVNYSHRVTRKRFFQQ